MAQASRNESISPGVDPLSNLSLLPLNAAYYPVVYGQPVSNRTFKVWINPSRDKYLVADFYRSLQTIVSGRRLSIQIENKIVQAQFR